MPAQRMYTLTFGVEFVPKSLSVHLISLADSRDARLIPGHDPIVWKAIWHPDGGHR